MVQILFCEQSSSGKPHLIVIKMSAELLFSEFAPLAPPELSAALAPKHNGGWFTGEAFHKGAGYGSVPTQPTAEFLIGTLSPEGQLVYPHYTRVGNNHQSNPKQIDIPTLRGTCTCLGEGTCS